MVLYTDREQPSLLNKYISVALHSQLLEMKINENYLFRLITYCLLLSNLLNFYSKALRGRGGLKRRTFNFIFIPFHFIF